MYVCGLIPEIGRSLRDQFENESGMSDLTWLSALSEPDAQARRAWVNRTLARELLFADCDGTTAERAIDRFRVQGFRPMAVPLPLSEFASVSGTSVFAAMIGCSVMSGPGELLTKDSAPTSSSFLVVTAQCCQGRQLWRTCCCR